jgi:hypothetical protein
VSRILQSIYNFQAALNHGSQFLTTWFAPRGERCPLGGMFTPSFTPRGEHCTVYLEEGGVKQRISPTVDYFTPRGQNSPPGDNFAPRGEVKNGPLSDLSLQVAAVALLLQRVGLTSSALWRKNGEMLQAL